MITIRRGTWAARTAMLALLIVGGSFTLRSGLAFFLATPVTAELALRIDPTNSDAMSMRADEWLKTVQMGDEAAQLTAFSKRTLERSPYEVVALRDIGFITAANDDEPGAAKLLSLAARLSLRDYLTHAWLLSYRFRTGQTAAAVHEADIVLRQQVENWDLVLPALVTLTRDIRVVEPLAQTLATGPYWRGTFLQKLGTINPNPAATFALFKRLADLGAPATSGELESYFVVAGPKMAPGTLFAQWLALLPPDARSAGRGLLRDGDFAGLDAPPPFGWRLYPHESVYAERVTGPAGMGNSLFVSFSGDKETVFADQELVLAPGHYRLSGRAYAEDAVDKTVFRWALVCMTPGHQAALGQVPIAPAPGRLTTYAMEFDVPTGCDQQQLALIGESIGDTFDTPAVYVDGLELRRIR
jgi:hypothetical protein